MKNEFVYIIVVVVVGKLSFGLDKSEKKIEKDNKFDSKFMNIKDFKKDF